MSEYKPYAERLKAEVYAFFRLWQNQRWLAIIFLGILLIVMVYFLIGWFTRGSIIQDLKATNRDLTTEIADLKRDLRSLEQESKGLRRLWPR